MAKIKVQAQYLKPGDIVGSGEKVLSVVVNSVVLPSNKVHILLTKDHDQRAVLWGKYTMIGVERNEQPAR